MAISAIEERGPVALLDPSEVPDDAFIIPTAGMGAPTVLMEKIPRGDEILEALRALERRFGRRAYTAISAEAGGVNSTIPLAVAARLRIPVVGGQLPMAEAMGLKLRVSDAIRTLHPSSRAR